MEKSEAGMNQGILEIQMLGDFSLRYGDRMLSGDKARGKQIWNFLEYIMVNRHKEISMDGLIQALWSEDETEDPANALKNLAYRLRTTLKQALGLETENCIVYKHGAYVWNKDIACSIDADEMEAAYKAAQQPGRNQNEQLHHYKEAIDIYKGNFMPQSSYKEWIVPLTVYYQRIFMESVAAYCGLLLEKTDYRTVEEVCRRAIAVDPFVEANHAMLIRAFIGSNSHDKAIAHYNYVNKLFYDELGVKPSDVLVKLYHEATKKSTAPEINIELIKDDLKESKEILGAVYCNYEEFKMVYQLEARAALRSGKSVFLGLIAVTGKQKKELSKDNFERTFERIQKAIVSSLRKDDLVTRYGRTQFLVLLANLTYENSNMVLGRLVEKINGSGISGIEVSGQLQALDPVELEERYV